MLIIADFKKQSNETAKTLLLRAQLGDISDRKNCRVATLCSAFEAQDEQAVKKIIDSVNREQNTIKKIIYAKLKKEIIINLEDNIYYQADYTSQEDKEATDEACEPLFGGRAILTTDYLAYKYNIQIAIESDLFAVKTAKGAAKTAKRAIIKHNSYKRCKKLRKTVNMIIQPTLFVEVA